MLTSTVCSPASKQIHPPTAITNLTTPCLTATSLCSNAAGYFFYDDVHPTTAADSIIAAQFQASAASTAVTPEPSSLASSGYGRSLSRGVCSSPARKEGPDF